MSPSLVDSANGSITIPALNNGTIGHIRQKPSRVGLGERQYSLDVGTGSSIRVMPRSNPSPPPLHHRQYSEGAGTEKTSLTTLASSRNASVSSFDMSTIVGSTNSLDISATGTRRRHGHSHSHAHSHHHHQNHPSPVPSKPASMMSILPAE